MKYAKIREYDVSNAPGICATLFVSGCTHNCEGCFNKEAQDFNFGEDFTKEVEDRFIEICKNPVVKGINILGGEPLQQVKDDTLLNLLKRLNNEVKKPIWMWSGYVYEEIISDEKRLELVKHIDVLVDGKFEISKKSLKLQFRGSSNQRVINMKETLNSKKIVLL